MFLGLFEREQPELVNTGPGAFSLKIPGRFNSGNTIAMPAPTLYHWKNMSEQFEAVCLCGGIQLRYSGEIGPANYCHCEDCRRANGSAFNIGVRVERKGLEVKATTELKAYRAVNEKGKVIERCFCGTCGSPIFTLHPDKPEFGWVKAGIICQPEAVRPAYEIWIRDKVTWATVDVPESFPESRMM